MLLPILLCGALLGSFDARELSKLPNVVSHYQHHRIDHGQKELSFFDFLADHFHSGGSDDPEHQDLPFLGGVSAEIGAIPLLRIQEPDVLPCATDLKVYNNWHPERVSDGRKLDIFQPPRLG